VTMLFDHVDLRVSDFAKVRTLYDALLPAMGFSQISEDGETVCYYRPAEPREAAFFGIMRDPKHRPNGSRIALRGRDRADVDRLAEVVRAAGAGAFEPPHICEDYTPFYYATFFEDADGNKLEICYRADPNEPG
jgi:catechol 2,3-dioxygenase-like lactoylglutathione lyase family enzyme